MVSISTQMTSCHMNAMEMFYNNYNTYFVIEIVTLPLEYSLDFYQEFCSYLEAPKFY